MEEFVINNGVLTAYKGKGGHIVIPDGVVTIGKHAFHDDLRLLSVAFGKDVRAIGLGAFRDCRNLRQVTFSDGLQVIGGQAFYGCKKLEAALLPKTLREIGPAAFSGCRTLAQLRLPEAMCKIARMAFLGCQELKSVTIPIGSTKIERGTFMACAALKEVALPQGLRVLEDYAFGYCDGLREIRLPSSVRDIRSLAFAHDFGLERVWIDGNPDPFVTEDVFIGCRTGMGIIAPHMDFAMVSGKRSFLLGYAEARSMGISYDAEQTALYTKYLRRQRKALYPYALELPSLMWLMTEEAVIPVEDVDKLVAECSNAESRAVLLDYKARNMTPQIAARLRRAEARRDERALMGAPLTVKEAKEQWRFVNENGRITITAYKGKDTEVIVPDRIGKGVVTGIGKEAFSPSQSGISNSHAREKITTIYIPETVTKIESFATSMCDSLRDVYLTASVTEIGLLGIDQIKGLTVHAPAGSFAEEYAERYLIAFAPWEG